MSVPARTAPSIITPDGESVPRYRADIDGMRALAIIAVVLFHAGLRPFSGGFVGVDIFFVISGFLIGGIVYRDIAREKFSFTTFYTRRAKRILPALIAMTLCVSVVGLAILNGEELRKFAQSSAASLLGISNLWFFKSTTYFSPDAHLDPFLMTWSLGVEEQFYLLFPPLMLLLHRIGFKAAIASIMLLCVLSLIVSVWGTANSPIGAFYLLPSRAWELGLGALVAVFQAQRPLRPGRLLKEGLGIVGLLLTGAAIFGLSEQTPFPGIAATLPVFGSLALICAEGSTINRRVLAAPPLVGIGLVSYSWYLWHWPLMAFVRVCSPEDPPVPLLLGVALLALAIGFLSWRFVERPFRQHGVPASSAPSGLLLRYGFALTACLLIPAIFYLGNGLPQRMVAPSRKIADVLAKANVGPCLTGYGGTRLNRSAACATTGPQPRVALLGDSHAAALGPTLRKMAQENQYGFIQFTKASCPPILDVTRSISNHPRHAAECLFYNRQAIAAVEQDKEVRTVILAAFWSAPFEADLAGAGDSYIDRGTVDASASGIAALRAGLERTVARLVHSGKRVVVLGDVPRFAFDPARQQYSQVLPARAMLQRILAPSFHLSGELADQHYVIPPSGNAAVIVQQTAQAVRGSQYLSLADTLCQSGHCKIRDGTKPYYIDSQHLTRVGAEVVLAPLEGAIWPGRLALSSGH